jgi:predicted ATPase/signal transduction histidine kinase/CheY-like chemotaxis protein
VTLESRNNCILSAPMPLQQFFDFGISISGRLYDIHQKNLIHTDIRPDNLRWDSNAEVWKLAEPTDIGTQLSLLDRARLPYISPEQTGRMNRRVDYRTDLYSLGVALYEMLVGEPPFVADDPLEMVHMQIARTPLVPHTQRVEVPEQISAIIMRLLEKNTDERYQSAYGLHHDLEQCARQWKKNGSIKRFELGKFDLTGIFKIPQKLYGRENELKTLLDSFEHISTGGTELCMVAGYSGVGKSALVREVQKPITKKRGFFIEGKFDQYKRNIPYFAWQQAFDVLVSQLLMERNDRLADWKTRIEAAVGSNGKVLTNIIRNLELVIGPQPEVPFLGGAEAQNRFNSVFQDFVKTVADKEHPLVVFLDDLQWIDSASLKLLQVLVTNPDLNHIQYIGAYRDNEVDTAHPLIAFLESLKEEQTVLKQITLQNILIEDVNVLIAETLQSSGEDTYPVAELIYSKTGGNAFFTHQILNTLNDENLLTFDGTTERWHWDMDALRALDIADNIVELLSKSMGELPAETQEVLKLAACLGNLFDPDILSFIARKKRKYVEVDLKVAVQEGVIFLQNGQYKFIHDSLQQAAYSLIAEEVKKETHLEIGRILLEIIPEEEREERIFDIINQLNVGADLLSTTAEQIQLAELNLVAGQKAKAGAAFADAKKYTEMGLDLLGTDPWQDHYDLTLSLQNENGELASFIGQFDQVSTTANLIHANAKNVLDQVPIYMVEIETAMMAYDFNKAVENGLNLLKQLEVDIPWQPSQEDYQRLVDKCLDLLTDKPKDVIDGLSEMTDERALAASSAIASMVSPSYITRPQLYPVILLTGVNLTVEYGYFPWSAFFISHIGSTLWMIKKLDTPADHVLEALSFSGQMHQAALKMIQKPIFTPSRAKVYEAVTLTGAFCQPLKNLIELAQTGYRSGFETGDILFGGFNALHCSILDLYDGMNLEEYRSLQIEYTQALDRFDQSTNITYISLYIQIATNFIEPFGEPHRLIGSFFDEDVFLTAAEAANDATGRHILYTYKLMLGYHFDQDNKLLELIDECERFVMGAPGLITIAITQFYSVLSKLRLYPSFAPENQKEALSQVDQSLRMMEIWSRSVPSTFQPNYDLMAAEKARVTGDLEGALTHYEQAITGARENGSTHDEALANELYARFWAERDNDRFAGPLMREAYSLYRKWGALAKADHLAKRYPKWVTTQNIVADKPGTKTTSEQRVRDLDLHTVLKTSQAIAGEISLDKLLAKMMHIVIENAEAQNGFLILARGNEWIIEAIADVDKSKVQVMQSIRIEDNDAVSNGIIRYVARTQETIVLADAADEGGFMDDPKIQQRRTRSILCAPLINQGKVSGIVYLENNLAADAFTSKRVALFNLLSSQMALALDNAQLYADMEGRVLKRTAELEQEVKIRKEAEEAAESANQAKSTFLANISHELRTPLNAILGFSRMLVRDRDVSDDQQEKLGIINRSGKHLLDMIEDILSLSKIEAGHAELRPETFEVAKMLQELGQMMKSRAEGKGLRFSLELDPTLPPYAKADMGKLRQILINLLGNAVKFTSEGGVSLRARALPIADDPSTVTLQLEIEDSGPGIAPKQVKEIFEPFIQAQQIRSSLKGTGLGLAISKSFVEMMDGEISVDSTPGKGSLFRVELPMVLVEAAEVVDTGSAGPAVLGLESGQAVWRILVVEDDPDNRLLLSSFLGKVGFEIREAENGEQAVALFEQWQPHFIWMDMRMPVMDGYEATTKIRSLPGGDTVKIVAITASAFKEQVKNILQAGCDEVVHKPFKEHEIFECMARQLGVKYIYEEKEAHGAHKPGTNLTAEMLADLPPDLLRELHKATLVLNRETILAVIERIEPLAPDTAKGLETLMDNFQVGLIRNLLGENDEK